MRTTVIECRTFYMRYANISITTKMYASMSAMDSITNAYGGEYLLTGIGMLGICLGLQKGRRLMRNDRASE